MIRTRTVLFIMAAFAATAFVTGCWDDSSDTITVETPAFTVTGDMFKTVTITCATEGAVIHYTMDGTAPTASSTEYSGALIVTGQGVSRDIQAIGVLSGVSSEVGATNVSISHYPLTLTADVTTLAGHTGYGYADATGTGAAFCYPYGVATDGTVLYVADACNNRIRMIVISTGVVSTLAGSGSYESVDGTGTGAGFYYPTGITTDGVNLYVTDNQTHKIRKVVIATGVVTTLAGSGSAAFADGTGAAASFHGPSGITTDGANLYVADYGNHMIRKVVISTGEVSTLAGSTSYGSADGTGTGASFNGPWEIAIDGDSLYVADYNNGLVRRVSISTTAVSTLATVNLCSGVVADGTYIYATSWNTHTIYKIVISSGATTTLAGMGYSGSVNGNGTAASFNRPNGITTDGSSLFIADRENCMIRKID
jgi:hypothetical protein